MMLIVEVIFGYSEGWGKQLHLCICRVYFNFVPCIFVHDQFQLLSLV